MKYMTYLGETVPETEPAAILEWLWKTSRFPESTVDEHVEGLIRRVKNEGHTLDNSSPEAMVASLVKAGFLQETK